MSETTPSPDVTAPGRARPAWGLLSPASWWRALVEVVTLLARQRTLILAMARRDLASQHAGSAAGAVWTVVNPLLQLGLFVIVFAVVFKQKIGGSNELPRDYAVYILSGLVPWLAIAPVLTASCSSIVANSALVKQFSFDVGVLPAKDAVSTAPFLAIGLVTVLVYSLFAEGGVPWTVVLLPVPVALLAATAIGLAFAVSALNVFLRDVRHVMHFLASVGPYVLPVVYLPQWVPEAFRPIIYLNPLSPLIWVFQDVLYFGRFEHPVAWGAATAVALVALAGGWRLFRTLRPAFGNVL